MIESPPEIWKPIAHPTLDAHAQEIGRLCIYWSELEMYVSLLLNELLDIQDATSKNVVFGILDLRAKLQALLPMAFARKPNEEWYAALETVVKEIDNKLRPERNRMVHDMWFAGDEFGTDAMRMQVIPKLVNEQSRRKVLKLAMTKSVSAEEIGRLYERVIAATMEIALIRMSYELATSSPNKLVAQALQGRQNLADSPPAPEFPPKASPRSTE